MESEPKRTYDYEFATRQLQTAAASVAHDMRKAMASVQPGSFTMREMLNEMFQRLDQLATAMTPEQQRQLAASINEVRYDYEWILESMSNDVDTIRRLLRELSDFSRNIPVELRFEPTDLRQCIESAASELKRDAEQKGAFLDLSAVQDIGFVDLDYRFQYVLKTLISTALESTSPGGTVAVRAHAVATDIQPEIEIEVAPIEYTQPKFRLWLSGSRGATGYPVGGLDVEAAKMIVQAHRGAIHGEIKEGVGTPLTLRIPVRQQ